MKISRKQAKILAGLVLFVIAAWGAGGRTLIQSEKLVSIKPDLYYQVTRVVDGDTFRLMVENQEITVRLLGINTPETVDPRRPAECYGPEASAAAKELLTGRQVRLELNPNREITDRYGRYLAYAYRDDGLAVNEYLLRQGFAREYTYGKAYSRQADFRQEEKTAQTASLGLWAACQQKI